ncbi:hypothetical protein J1614_010781 [Plenodomus biglobosus]|nr:hypothetical protein J1614_010781 [Plenodomus biglobosus]
MKLAHNTSPDDILTSTRFYNSSHGSLVPTVNRYYSSPKYAVLLSINAIFDFLVAGFFTIILTTAAYNVIQNVMFSSNGTAQE